MMDHYDVPHQRVELRDLGPDERAVYICDTQNLHSTQDFFSLLSPAMKDALRRDQVMLCLDGSNRPLLPAFSNIGPVIEQHFLVQGITPPQVAVLTCDMGETQAVLDRRSPNSKLVIFNYSVSADYVRERCLHYLNSWQPTIDLRPYKFLCLMNFPHDHRVLLMLHLLKWKLDQEGIIGFINGPIPRPDIVACAQLVERYGIDSDILQNVGPMLGRLWAPDNYPAHDGNDCWITPQHYNDSYFNITAETFWAQQQEYYTEKITKPVLFQQPFILLGSAHTLSAFRQRGFKTFHPYIDESYDYESDPLQRLRMVIDQIDRLCKMDTEQLHKWYHGPIKPIVEHNYRVFMDKTTTPLHGIVEKLDALVCR